MTPIIDNSGHGAHCINTGVAIGSGVSGKGAYFDGNHYLSINYSPINEPFTMSCCFNTTLLKSYEPGIMSFGWCPIFNMRTDGKIRFWWYNGSSYPGIVSNAVLSDGQWHHCSATYDGLTVKMYVDGVLQGLS